MNLEIKFVLVFESPSPSIFLLCESRDNKEDRKISILLQQNETAYMNHTDILEKKRTTKPNLNTNPGDQNTNPKSSRKTKTLFVHSNFKFLP